MALQYECNTWQCRVGEYVVFDERNTLCPGCMRTGRRLDREYVDKTDWMEVEERPNDT